MIWRQNHLQMQQTAVTVSASRAGCRVTNVRIAHARSAWATVRHPRTGAYSAYRCSSKTFVHVSVYLWEYMWLWWESLGVLKTRSTSTTVIGHGGGGAAARSAHAWIRHWEGCTPPR